MSLTSILAGKNERDKAIREIIKSVKVTKKEFYTASGKVAFSPKEYVDLVPYTLDAPYKSGVVGTASDYLFRLILAGIIERHDIMEDIVARRGLIRLEGYDFDKEFILYCNDKFKDCIDICNNFISNKIIDENVVNACIVLSYFESIVRAGIYDMYVFKNTIMSAVDKTVAKDVFDLGNVFKEKFIKENKIDANSKIIFNPHFGEASLIVGGADADVIIGDILYDFKSTKKIGFVGVDVSQLVGYRILNQIYNENSKEQCINKIAFYKSRYGETEIVDITEEKVVEIKKAARELLDFE